MANYFASNDFFADYVLPMIKFYRRTFLPTFFLETRAFSIFLLKNTLSLSIRL